MRSTRKRKYRKRYGGTPKRLKAFFGVPAPDARRRRAVVPTNESQTNFSSLISVPNSRSTRSNPSQLYQPLTPPMCPRDYPSELKHISKELGRVEKERDELLVKLTNFNNEIKELETMLATEKKKKTMKIF